MTRLRMRGATTAAAVIVGLDQISKLIAHSALEHGESVNVFFGLDISSTRNTGVAFGLFAGNPMAVAILVACAGAGLAALLIAARSRPRLWVVAGLIVGGAVGNAIDRVWFGYVRDFIDPVWFPAFNLADTAITFGVVGLMLAMWSEPTG